MAAVPSLEKAIVGINTRATIDFLKDSPKKLHINGKWVPAKSGKTFESINPADEEVLALVAEGDKPDIDEAVKAARKAFEEGKWSSITPHQRSRYLYKIADLIEQHADQLAELESLDNGKPLAIAKMADIPGAARTFRYYTGWPCVSCSACTQGGHGLDQLLQQYRSDLAVRGLQAVRNWSRVR